MNTKEQIKSILCVLGGVSEISDESSLQDDLMLDSLSMVMLLVEIEDAFDIKLDESDMNPFELVTVQEVVDMVQKYVGEIDE